MFLTNLFHCYVGLVVFGHTGRNITPTNNSSKGCTEWPSVSFCKQSWYHSPSCFWVKVPGQINGWHSIQAGGASVAAFLGSGHPHCGLHFFTGSLPVVQASLFHLPHNAMPVPKVSSESSFLENVPVARQKQWISEGQGSMRIAPGHTMRRPQPTGLIPQVKPSYSHRHPLAILGAWPAKDSNLYVLRQDQTTTEVDWVAVRCWHLSSRSSRWRWRRSWPNWNPWKISFWEKSWRKNLRVTKRCLSWTWGRQWPRPKGHPAKRYHCQTGMVRQLKNEAPQEADICWACSFPIPEILVALTNLDVWPRHIRNVWLMVSHVQP